MKKVFLTVIFGLTMLWAQAQIEVKINPIGTLFGSPDLSGEYIVNENFGLEHTNRCNWQTSYWVSFLINS